MLATEEEDVPVVIQLTRTTRQRAGRETRMARVARVAMMAGLEASANRLPFD